MNTEDIKKERLDVMIDLETTSRMENAGILSISLVPFHLNGMKSDEDEFDCVVDLNSCFMSGMEMSDSQQWWMQQDPHVKSRFFNEKNKLTITTALNEVYKFISLLNEKYDIYLWSRGIDFDFPKLEWGFRNLLGKDTPYKFSHKRDVRTFIKELNIDESEFENTNKHWSLNDCMHQIMLVQAAYNKIQINS